MIIDNYISRLSSRQFVIFLFHGVIKRNISSVRNYNRKHILESEFYELIKSLHKNGSPVHMEDIIERGADLPEKAYAITFDDGFENNHSIAAPILKEFCTPATFYITSDFVDKNKMSWIDQIDYAVEQTKKDHIKWMEKSFPVSTVSQKIEFLQFVRGAAKGSQSFFLDKDRYIRDIFDQCAVSSIDSLENALDLKMDWSQVCDLSSDPLFTIGGHTHTHPIMSYLEQKDLKHEIAKNIALIKEKCLLDISHFSYPEGLDFCFNEKVINMLKNYGIKCCPTAIDGTNSIEDDKFLLKRITVV